MTRKLFLAFCLLSPLSLLAQKQIYVDFYDSEQTQMRSKGNYERGVEQGKWLYYHPSRALSRDAPVKRAAEILGGAFFLA